MFCTMVAADGQRYINPAQTARSGVIFPMLFDLLKDPTNCSVTVHCKWTSLSTAGVCVSVFVHRAASGQKS